MGNELNKTLQGLENSWSYDLRLVSTDCQWLDFSYGNDRCPGETDDIYAKFQNSLQYPQDKYPRTQSLLV